MPIELGRGDRNATLPWFPRAGSDFMSLGAARLQPRQDEQPVPVRICSQTEGDHRLISPRGQIHTRSILSRRMCDDGAFPAFEKIPLG